MPYPRCELGLVLLATSILLAILFLPAQSWWHPVCRGPMGVISGCWLYWRALALDRALVHYRDWTRTPRWVVVSEDLLLLHDPDWRP